MKLYTSDDTDIKSEQQGAVLILTINRPEVHNAFNPESCKQLGRLIDQAKSNDEVRVIIVTGAGEKAFSAGFDLAYAEQHPEIYDDPLFGSQILRRPAGDKPLIAAVNGIAMGMGFEFALACDLIVASKNATFCLPEPMVGLAAMGGGIARLSRDIGQKRALGIVLTARKVSAVEGLALGFVNEVSDQSALKTALVWAEKIIAGGPLSIAASKEIARASVEMSLEKALDPHNYPLVLGLLKSEDVHEGRQAFLERRRPNWKGR